MDGLSFFLVGCVALLIFAIIFALQLPDPSTQTQATRVPDLDFIPTQMYRGTDGMSGLAVNEQTNQICLFKNPNRPPRLFSLGDLIGTFLVKNGEIIGQGLRTRPKTIQGFVKALQSQVISLINSSMPESRDSNQRIDLIVGVYDPEDPLYVITFLDMETKEGGILFEKAMSTGNHWHYLLDGLILKADHLSHVQGEIRNNLDRPSTINVTEETDKHTELPENQGVFKHASNSQKAHMLAGKV